MGWLIGAAVVLGGILLATKLGSGGGFDFRGRRYRRQGDGGFTYADGGAIDNPKERADVEAHWNDSQSSDSGSDGGGGDGGGGD